MTNRIALLLIRKYEIEFVRISRKNTKKSIQRKITIFLLRKIDFEVNYEFFHVYMTHIIEKSVFEVAQGGSNII